MNDASLNRSTYSSYEIILLHGYGSRVRDLNELGHGFGSDRTVLTPDLSGFYLNREKYTFTDQVNMLTQIIEKLVEGRDFHLVGVSYGGALAWALASRLGPRCKSVSMINPMAPFPVKNLRPLPMRIFFSLPWNAQVLFRFLKGAAGGEVVGYLLKFFGRRLKLRRGKKTTQFVTNIIHNFLTAVSEEDWGAWELNLAQIKCAALICYSPNDPLFQPKSFVKLGGALEDVRFIKLNTHLHLPTPEQLSDLSRTLKDFIQHAEALQKAA